MEDKNPSEELSQKRIAGDVNPNEGGLKQYMKYIIIGGGVLLVTLIIVIIVVATKDSSKSDPKGDDIVGCPPNSF